MIQLDNVSITAGTFTLPSISFEVPTGSYAVLMGKSGAGKTTILEAICGLRTVTSGRIRLSGRDVTQTPPAQRNIGFVPQEGVLFLTMSVYENLAVPLHIRRRDHGESKKRIGELAELLGIAHLLHRLPHGISGGERQRIALGRALIFSPDILCLDEPLSALDEETKQEMYALLRSIRRYTSVTTLHITHHRQDVEELADLCVQLHNDTIATRAVPYILDRHTAFTDVGGRNFRKRISMSTTR